MTRRRQVRIAAALCVLAAVVAVVVASIVQVYGPAPTAMSGANHPAFNPTQACDSKGCHANTHRHRFPYLGDCAKCHGLESWRAVSYMHADPNFNSGTAVHSVVGCDRCHTEGGRLPSKACQSCHSSPHGGWRECANCHTPIGWIFRLPPPEGHLTLAGGHSHLKCPDCHNRPSEPASPRECADCHGGEHHGGLTACGDCHSPATFWKPSEFNHDDYFKRVGHHALIDCTGCHPNYRFANTSSQCVSCHGSHHGGLTDCARCHTPLGFIPPLFDHDTVFPRTGGPHEDLACSRCHPGNAFAIVRGKTCVTCHGPQHNGQVVCTPCHAANGAVVFSREDHTPFFPLAGGPHADLACSKCHSDGDYAARRGATCITCHGPQHGGLVVCRLCHAANGTVVFNRTDHTAFFPLAGGPHADLACSRCHPTGDFSEQLGSTCTTCHGLGHGRQVVCAPCHGTNGAVIYPFDHTPFFQLAGGPHATLACVQCHPSGVYKDRRGAVCTTCHGLGHGRQVACAPCHAANGAVIYPFDHTLFFQLAGGPHAALACVQCHPSGVYSDRRGATCIICHGPQHGGLTACTSCHAANGTADHTPLFELVGFHTTLACSACHGDPFHPAPGTNCVDCHGVHHGNQTQCDLCHTTDAFVPHKPIVHPAPIVLGPEHSSRPCQLCHPTLTFNLPNKPCSDCHTPPHVGPLDCFRCHMPTVWTDLAKFTHPSIFPHDTGAFDCIQCHVGYNFTLPRSQICSTCHPLQ